MGNKILTIAGILNGTTNYILSRMDAEGADYADVLADAQAKGYAEADPSADVDGFDAASKTAILASIGFGTRVTTDDVYQQGIRTIAPRTSPRPASSATPSNCSASPATPTLASTFACIPR